MALAFWDYSYTYDHARVLKERIRRLQIAHRKAAERGLTPGSVLFDAAVQSILRKKYGVWSI